MTDAQFCLEWDSHNRNICTGLSSLQQNGEFVDMTLASDGHHVKVHQMVLALASPYIKELISSANCPHPVIFLNKVSYKTLCSILEYIYTGQTMVAVEEINELIMAAKELHIKGLEDVKTVAGEPQSTDKEQPSSFADEHPSGREHSDVQIKLQHQIPAPTPVVSKLKALKSRLGMEKTPSNMPLRKRSFPPKDTSDSGTTKDMPVLVRDDADEPEKSFGFDDAFDDDDNRDDDDDYCVEETPPAKKANTTGPDNAPMSVQYTLSNQGSLQLILNRFVYSLYYQYRDKSRQWRCIDNRANKCMASVFTKDNIVIRRVGAHTHPFHDKNILKKVRNGAVFSALQEAEAKTTKPPRMHHADKEKDSK